MGVKTCACGCGRALPADAHPRQKYFDKKHQKRMEARRYRARKRAKEKDRRSDGKPLTDQSKTYLSKDESDDGRASARRGPGYEWMIRNHAALFDAYLAGEKTGTQLAAELKGAWPDHMPELSGANLSRWAAARVEDKSKGAALDRWSRAPDVEEALGDFKKFCLRYFADDPDIGLLPEFHIEWADAITDTLNDGGKLLLLGPQRHGKSSLLIKYVMWRICIDPDICIMWVGKSENVASESTGLVRQYLEHHEKMVEEVFGPGVTLVPETRSGFSWTDTKLTISQRTRIRKSPTLVALGITGNILGRDADLIVVDDPVEHRGNRGMTAPNNREEAYERLVTDVNSRKMKKTGFAYIGSRQHVDDPPGRIIKKHAEDWRILIYQAHDPACVKQEKPYGNHIDCMLWPNAPHLDFQWLMGQKRMNSAHFERNYMNNPQDNQLILVSAEDIERCKDYKRRAGQIPKGVVRLIAGIDPADAKPVAAVLWGHEAGWGDKGRRHIIDIMEAEPGIRGGRRIFEHWYEQYRCQMFVVEKNMAQSWLQDTDVRDFKRRTNIQIIEHYTDRVNKWNEATGVLAMFGRMREDPPSITIPWGDQKTVEKMERLARTFLLFDPDYAGHKHADDDLPMAAWFPQPVMDGWINHRVENAIVDYRQTPYLPTRTPYVPNVSGLSNGLSIDDIENHLTERERELVRGAA